MVHEVILSGYNAYLPKAAKKRLKLGTAESYGIEKLRIIAGEGWNDVLITATFHPASGAPVKMVVDDYGDIAVPWEATAKATSDFEPGAIVFSGTADGMQRISADLPYYVEGHSPVDGAESEPTESQWEQLAEAYNSKVSKVQGAENAGKYLSVDEEGNVFTDEARLTDEAKLEIVAMVKHPEKLPNPSVLTFEGAATGTYDGSAPVKINIPKPADVPEKLPNPSALTFEGAATGTYDGSAPVKINIPKPADLPERLPNPKALVFEGAVEATYDGSDVVRVNIPKAGVDEGAILDILVALEIAPVILDGDGSILADPTGAIIVNH